MYTELACYDREQTEEQVQTAVFTSLGNNIKGISVPVLFVPLIKEIIPPGTTLSCPIDYPSGIADVQIRNHAILNAVRKGATAVDLVANISLVINNKLDTFIQDLKSSLEICNDSNISLRLMLEYRLLDEKTLLDIARLVKVLGIEYVFPSTGHMVDNIYDNILAAIKIHQETEINVIVNGNIWKSNQYKVLEKSDIFGIRFHSVNAISNIFV